MFIDCRGALLGASILLAASLDASVSIASADPARADDEAVSVTAAAGGTSALTTLAPAGGQRSSANGAGVLPIRHLEPSGEVTGLEPDPEMFDREGLERWWREYQSRHPEGR